MDKSKMARIAPDNVLILERMAAQHDRSFAWLVNHMLRVTLLELARSGRTEIITAPEGERDGLVPG